MMLNKYKSCFIICLQLVGCIFVSHVIALGSVNHGRHYLELFASPEAAPKSFESYDDARRLAMQWVSSSHQEVIEWLVDNPEGRENYAAILLLETLTRVSFDSSESVLRISQQLPEEYRTTYLHWVISIRSQSKLTFGDDELRLFYFAHDDLVYVYAGMCVDPDFEELIASLSDAGCSPEAKTGVYGILLERWLDHAPDEVEAHLQGKTLHELSQHEGFIRMWANETPEKAVGLLSRLSADYNGELGVSERGVLAQAMQSWLHVDESAALAWVDSVVDPKLSGILVRSVVEASMKRDGSLAAVYFSKIPDEASRTALAPELAKVLADRNPVAGVEWLRNTTSLMDLRPAVAEFYFNLAKYDVAYAVETYPSELPVGLQQESVRVIMASADQVGLEEVYDWMESLEPRASHEYVLPYWFQKYVALDPERAAEYIRQHPLSGKHHRPSEHVGAVWAQDDPDAAKQWAMTLTNNKAQGGAGYGVVEGLLQVDDQEALDWIATLPTGQMRNWAVDALYDHRWEQRPEVVFDLALSVTNTKRRKKYIKGSIQAMRTQGTLDTAAILQRSDLPVKDRDWLVDLLAEN